MITAEFTPTASMHFKAGREVFHSTSIGRLFYVILIFVTLNTVVFSFMGSDKPNSTWVMDNSQSLLIVLALLTLTFVVLPLLHYWSVLRSLKTNHLATAKRVCDFTQSGLRIHGDGFDFEFTWRNITRIKVSRRFLFAYVGNSVACFAPRELFSKQDISQIERWIANK